MAESADPSGGPVSPLVALGLATVTFVALLIFGLGMVTLVLSAAVVEEPGLGPLPGIVATAVTTGAFALALWLALRTPQPSYGAVLWGAASCYLAYVGAMWLGVLISSGEFAVAASVAGRIATTGFGAAVALAGALSAWGGITLTRTRGQRPQWPWEEEFDP